LAHDVAQMWLPHLGSMTVMVNIPGCEAPVRATGTLAQVSALMYMSERDGPMSVGSLAELMDLPQADVHKLLSFWSSQSVLRPLPEEADDGTAQFGIMDQAQGLSSAAAPAAVVEGEAEDALGEAVRAQQEAVVRQFAIGMLRTHGSLPLERILAILRVFSPCKCKVSWREEGRT
jgi:hypothetical protein